MATKTNTQLNIGHSREIGGLGMRNFEPSGTVQYKSARSKLYVGTVAYNIGQTIPFDVGGVSYSPARLELLESYWDHEWIEPLV